MKKRIIVLLSFLLSLPAFAQTGNVVFTWTGNGNPTLPACSTTVTTSCLTGYTLSDITSLSSPVVVSSAIAESALTYTLAPLPTVGSHTYSLVVNGKDQSSNAISSTPASVTLTIPSFTLNPPIGFAGTP